MLLNIRIILVCIVVASYTFCLDTHAQTITAAPNPCIIPESGYNCTSTLSWPPSSAYDLWVTVPATGFTSIVAGGLNGPVTLPWIAESPTIFQLRTRSGVVLASTTVQGLRPSLSASPNPCSIPAGQANCTSVLSWYSSPLYDLWVTIPATGFTSPVAAGSSGTTTLPWISADASIFQLRDVSTGVTYRTISVNGQQSIAPPSCSSVSPQSVNVYTGQAVSLSAICSGTISGYEWTAAPNGPAVSGSLSSVTTGVFNSVGTYVYTARAYNAVGYSSSVSATITVLVPSPTCSSLSASPSASVLVGGSTLLTANCADLIVSYSWTALAGAPPALSNTSSVTVGPFNTTGSFTYTVQATNSSGTQSAPVSLVINVSPRICDAATTLQVNSCLAEIRNNTKDHLRVIQSISCSSSADCYFQLGLPNSPRTIPIEIYGANSSIIINRAGNPTTPIFELVGMTQSSGGSEMVAGTVTNAARVNAVTIRDIKLTDSLSVVANTCTAVPLASQGYNSPIVLSATNGVTLSRVIVETCGFAAVQVNSADNLTITDSIFRGGKYYGVWMAGYRYGDYGTEWNTRQNVNNNLTVINNKISLAGANALFISGTNTANIANNEIFGNHRDNPFGVPGGQLLIEAGSTNIGVVNNIIRDSKPTTLTAGIEFGPTIELAKINGIRIRSNMIYNIAGSAIVFDCPQGNVQTSVGCSFLNGFTKPFVPENVEITSNLIYNAGFEIPASTSYPRYAAIPNDGRFTSIMLDGNFYGATASTALTASFGSTPTSCNSSQGSCTVSVGWSSNNLGTVSVRQSGNQVAALSSGTLNASISSPGATLEIYSLALPYTEPIARRWVKTN